MLTIERSLNVYAAGIPQIINLSQYDEDFQLVFSLYTSEGALTIPTGSTAEIMGTKTDGNGYSANAAISDNTVTVDGNVQMTACAGRNVFEIVLTNSSKRLATINFILQVERAAMDADTIQSETVLNELQAIIDGADRAEDAAESAETARDAVQASATQIETNKNDITDLKEDLSKKAPVIINTSDEAEVVTFADGADDTPMKSLVLKLVPHQEGSGDPSPDNVRPITGYTSVGVTRAGKNLCPRFTSGTGSGLTYTVSDNGELTITGTNTGTAFKAVPFTLPAGTYVLNGAPNNGQLTIRSSEGGGAPSSEFSGSLDDYGSGATFTVSARASAWLNIRSTAGTHNQVYKPMIRLASISDPTYEPYTADTYPITIPSSAGTVYGGELDVTNGVLKVTDGQIASYSGQSINTPWISSKDVYASGGTPTTGAQVVYPLTTPTEITLDKTTMTTLLGSNTIWMNADGTIQCDYPADTKMYIDALTAPDDDMIADSNIASGKYFTVNNRLYISTSAIAQGEQIVVGTNCTQTDLATALNALNA